MSQHLPALKPARVLRALERAGFFVHHVKGSHYILKHPDKPHVRTFVGYFLRFRTHDTPSPRRCLRRDVFDVLAALRVL
jgi:predicted RNA binding protein YcfA (HicA-like mRNA interferase family)